MASEHPQIPSIVTTDLSTTPDMQHVPDERASSPQNHYGTHDAPSGDAPGFSVTVEDESEHGLGVAGHGLQLYTSTDSPPAASPSASLTPPSPSYSPSSSPSPMRASLSPQLQPSPPMQSRTLSPQAITQVHSHGHARQPSDPTLLYPTPIITPYNSSAHNNRSRSASLEVPPASPSLSILSGGSISGGHGAGGYPLETASAHLSTSVPPSPTLSNRSSVVHFATTKDLRENRPDEHSGMGSLKLLDPGGLGGSGAHARKSSVATTIVGDSSSPQQLHPPDDFRVTPRSSSHDLKREKSASGVSHRTSFTLTQSTHDEKHGGASYSNSHFKSDSKGAGNEASKKSNGESDPESSHPNSDGHPHIEFEDDVDPAPFNKILAPFSLASLVDPKNMKLLNDMGGIEGVTRGLQTDPVRGLSLNGLSPPHGGNDEEKGAGEGMSQRHERQDEPKINIVIHGPNDGDGGNGPTGSPKGVDPRSNASTISSAEGLQLTKHTLGDVKEEKPTQVIEDLAPNGPVSLEDRKRVYGENFVVGRKTKSLLQLMWTALKDKVLVLLTIAAVVSLALGLFQDFGTQRPTFSCGDGKTCTEPPVDWVEGVAIMVAVIIVVVVGSINDWQKEKQFKALNEKKEDRTVKVIRDGVERVINIKEVVVGDVALLEPGEIIPCDGIFLKGHNVKCDESGATGESDAIKKLSYSDLLAHARKVHADRSFGQPASPSSPTTAVPDDDTSEQELDLNDPSLFPSHTDCFVISGSKVLEGVGSYVVIAVGPRSFNGRIMLALRGDSENTPLQIKLNRLAELIAKLGSAAGLLLFTALMIRFFVQLGTGQPIGNQTAAATGKTLANQRGLAFVQILIISVTLIVVAVPEGLPLAVTLALAFATKRMTAENLLVRVLGSCEAMANASVVCTDKTGTLTQNKMSVVAGSVGISAKFVQHLKDNMARTNAGEQPGGKCEKPSEMSQARPHPEDFSIEQGELNRVLSPALQELFNEAIAVNSTAFEDTDLATGELAFVGSKTETALLNFAKDLGWRKYSETRAAADDVQAYPFSSERKAMGTVVRLRDGRYRFYVKGASEILTKKCANYVVVLRPDATESEKISSEVETKPIDERSRDNIQRTIIFYANQTLRTIALCYRDFESWPPSFAEESEDGEVPYEALANSLTLISITGIEDPLRPGVREAVADCRKAGVDVKMCTGDNVLTARSIALQCGIFTPGGIIMEGPVFRQLTHREMMEVVPRLQVLARSSPEDKKILVEKLKSLGEIVGVTGDGTNDGPALKTANVGFSMGIAGTEVAKEASDIILMDDNFASIVKAIMWGRCVNDAVRKFLQFQISVNITAVIVTFVSAVASSEEESVLSAVQLLWINIIMDTFAALALATDPASPALLDRKPESNSAPLFSVDMYKQIVGQSMFQVTFTLILHFAGNSIFGYRPDPNNESVMLNNTSKLNTLVFNSFVFANIFNSINCRRIDKKLNVFEGITRNYYFMVITLIEIGVQILIVFVGGQAFQVTKINGRDWGISLVLGVLSLLVGLLIRLLPNEPFERILIKLRIHRDPNALPTVQPEAKESEWNSAITLVRDNLNTFSNVRGGRLRSSSFVIKSRSARLEEAGVKLPSLLTMVPTLVASSIGAGWAPQHGSLSDPGNTDPSRSSAALWEGKIQLHPDTQKDDPAFKRWGNSLSTDASQAV